MSKFNYLESKRTKNKQVYFETYEINPDESKSTLTVLPSTAANSKYMNAFLKQSNVLRRRTKKSKDFTLSELSELRNLDKELFPEHVIVGWENVKDGANSIVPFNKENCTDLIAALPDFMFDELRDYCANPYNFINLDTVEDIKN